MNRIDQNKASEDSGRDYAITTWNGGNSETDEWLTYHGKGVLPGVDIDVWPVVADRRKGRLGLFR
jgi:hypothetical protein